MRSQLGGSARRSESGPFGKFFKLLGVLLLVAVAGAVALAWYRVGEPVVSVEPGAPGIGRKALPVLVRAAEPSRGLASVRLEVVQGDRVTVVAERAYEEGPRPFWAFWGPRVTEDELEAGVGLETVEGLEEGEATLRAVAERPGSPLRSGEPVAAEVTVPVRLRPPSLSVVSSQHYVTQGGSGVVAYRVGESALAEGGTDGVQAGERFFPGHPLPGGGPGERFALFGVPWDLGDPNGIQLVATDPMENRAEVDFVDRWFPEPPRSDTIRLADEFLEKVVPEIMDQEPELEDRGSLVSNYVQINSELRESNRRRLVELAAESRAEFLWSEPFVPLPGGQVMSAFADRRTYVYEGETVDRQTHLGYDLATVRRDRVPAANRGVVLLAEYLGIYGNVVVLDHGYGLMTLYAHLSSFAVEPGELVEAGQTLGRTGETGLAGGDHLHFTTLVGGMPVDPVEWWDTEWIGDRVAPKLGDALPYRR